MRPATLVLALVAALLAAQARCDGPAPDGSMEVRVRAIYLYPKSATALNESLDGGFYGDLSAEWFFTPRWSAELALAFPTDFTHHYFDPMGAPLSDDIKLMPNTLTVKYSLQSTDSLYPYLGAGMHYTTLSRDSPNPALGVQSPSVGWTAQTGLEWRLIPGWYFNADVRYLGNLETRTTAPLAPQTHLRIDPFLFGIGFGFRPGGS
ncbi:MAG TPA: OmpW family outer membrane protein [Steroidobacteraceae bacterium]|nr:OmpW family outer membrane protein [Steroidobacteraceae bacterium]